MAKDLPVIIQGGMGVGVSGWRLARAVGKAGQMGVVSGVALDAVHARRLNDGDVGGHLRRAYEHFPVPEIAERALDRYFIEGGRGTGQPYTTNPKFTVDPSPVVSELTILANFAEVWLAKQGHDRPVGINYLEKVQLPTVHSTFGAMLAGVDYIIMGAGIPKQMPQVISRLAMRERASYRLTVEGSSPDAVHEVTLDPTEIVGDGPPLARPDFLAIISSNTLATFLSRDPTTRPDGFVIEASTAGGHNAPPRGPMSLDEAGQPIYGPKDEVDLAKLAEIGLPYWLAGSYGTAEQLRAAREAGAAGVQVGTAFAFCEESDLATEIKTRVIDLAIEGKAEVITDPVASPSGYPFKVIQLDGTLCEPEPYDRGRICDQGYLRSTYEQSDGSVGYRCAAEPVKAFVRKGGSPEAACGRRCLCNALLANIGLPQVRDGRLEGALVTAGDDVAKIVRFLPAGQRSYRAVDVIAALTAPTGYASSDLLRDASSHPRPVVSGATGS